ncbi:MAG: type IV secretory system conjugative DNA transfer family protein [Patescibacteria group bacterium]
MERVSVQPEIKFRNPDEEAVFLRERLKEIERTQTRETPEAHARELAVTYGAHAPEDVLEKGHVMLKPEVDAVVLDLMPEDHDNVMAELLSVMKEKGVRNALSVVHKMDDPHVEDDFHRFLSEYLRAGYQAQGMKEGTPEWKALHMTLFEVTLPFGANTKETRPLRELLASMEQLYAGVIESPKGAKKNHFTLEIAVESHHEHATIYCAVPTERKQLFERQLLSLFPQAHITESHNDYNIFSEGGVSLGSIASYKASPAYALKTYDAFEYDPLNVVLSAFAKLKPHGEGAALQVLVRPASHEYAGKFKGALEKIQKGAKAKEALKISWTMGDQLIDGFSKAIFGAPKKKKGKEDEPIHVDELAVEQIKTKIAHPIADVSVRLLASAENDARAEAILGDLESAFQQLENPQGNSFVFKRAKGSSIKTLLRDFTYRTISTAHVLPMNLRELATIFHLPVSGNDTSRELKRAKARTAPLPIGVSHEGIVIGTNKHTGSTAPVHFAKEDRLRHFYCIGQTGTGKTTMLKNMIIQDIKNGEGVCMIDPHGTDILDVLAAIPKEREQDVIYFDPSYTERPMGLNMLEYDQNHPEQKTFVVNELFSIFQKLYGNVPESMGPMFEQYFRNATMLVIEDPITGNTLFDVSRVLSDKAYRELKLSHCHNPVVVQFWRDVAEKAGGEGALANIVPYITSKFDVFLSNDIMRPIVVQSKSAFNFRDIMDNKKILLVNLAKGRLGDINANLLGLIIVGKILMAALSRVDAGGRDLSDFYLYIDEFQNITTDSIATILSEARKYKLGLTVAHQFIKQLDERIRDAVFGNVGSLCAFRVGSDDAEYLEKQFAPVFDANDLMNIDNRNAIVKMLINGRPERPFTVETIKPEAGDRARIEELKALSYDRYGRPRADVERDIRAPYGML